MTMSWRAAKKATKWDAARKMLANLDRDDMLARIGLEERSPASDWAGGLGLFALGMLVGAGMGILFAPRRGDEVRSMMTDAWKNRRPEELRNLGAEGHSAPSGF
jgi:hypothetical protein